jgi:hypothetical protein
VGRRPLGFRLALGLSALLIRSLAAPARAAAPAQNPDVKAGQPLYATHCAVALVGVVAVCVYSGLGAREVVRNWTNRFRIQLF